MKPSAAAVLPVMFRYLPGKIFAGLISYETAKSSAFSAKLWPARSARRLASTTSGVLRKRSRIHFSAGSIGRWYSQDVMPRQKKFRQRNTARAERPRSLRAVVVSFVTDRKSVV